MAKNVVIVGIGALILCFSAFYNKFPLLNENSATFIASAFNVVHQYQVMETYGLFIKLASFSFSIWLVVIAQALILSLTVFYCFKYFRGGKNFQKYYLGFVFFISFFMSASIGASTIGNAVFLNTSILCLSLVVFAEKLSTRDLYIIFLVGLVSLCMDLINILLALSVLLILVLGKVSKIHLITFNNEGQRHLARILLLVIISALTFGSIVFYNYKSGTGNSFKFPYCQKIREFVTKKDARNPTRCDDLFFIDEYPSTAKDARLQASLRSGFSWEFRENMLSHQYRRSVSLKYSSIIQIILSVICISLVAIKSRSSEPVCHRGILLFYGACFVLCFVIPFSLQADLSNHSYQTMWILTQTAFLYAASKQPQRQFINTTNDNIGREV